MTARSPKTKAVTVAVDVYADALGIKVEDIPQDQHIAVMKACVEAVKVALDEFAEEFAQ